MMYFGNVGTVVEEFPSRVANKSRKRNLTVILSLLSLLSIATNLLHQHQLFVNAEKFNQ
jgi:hypothetical protein